MDFPSFNRKPDAVIDTPERSIHVFENGSANIDRKTVASFGSEWKAFHGFSQEEIQKLGENYFDIVSEEMLNRGDHVLEVGCGSGRFLKFLSNRVLSITGVDPSEAVFAANQLLGKDEKVQLVKASASDLPYDDASFDFVYSIGVLHHIPDTARAMKDCVRKLKQGGYFLTYIYYNLDNRGIVFRALFGIVNGMRALISKMPGALKRFSCDLLAVFLYMPFVLLSRVMKIFRVSESNRRKIPLQFYEDKSFYIIRNDALDRFGTPLEQRFSKAQIKTMMEEAGLTDIIFSEKMPYWHAVGRKK